MPSKQPPVLFHHMMYKGPRKKRKRSAPRRPELTIAQILAWADAYHEETGKWPKLKSGKVARHVDETWAAVESALNKGIRGLHGGSSLAKVLAKHRGVRNIKDLPPLQVRQILSWADAHHKRIGQWPRNKSGPIIGTSGETWMAVDQALRVGVRGLPGGSGLSNLLKKHRGVRNHKALPHLTVEQVLAWADAHYKRSGTWPKHKSGPVLAAPSETWLGVDVALRAGIRGLPGGSSLAQLLSSHRNVRNQKALAPLTTKIIVAWADAHHQRTGKWPTPKSGPILEANGERWSTVEAALENGNRGLSRGSSLARVLAEFRGIPNRKALPNLTIDVILSWADTHREKTGEWPTPRTGAIPESGGTWLGVDVALRQSRRGLPGGSSLGQLLAEHRNVRRTRQ